MRHLSDTCRGLSSKPCEMAPSGLERTALVVGEPPTAERVLEEEDEDAHCHAGCDAKIAIQP